MRRVRSAGSSGAGYTRPTLEHQTIIRFPPDIAARLAASMEDETVDDFVVRFTDERHAVVDIFGEKMNAILVALPTLLESHKTVDGTHLFKSGDIGEILIVHRPSSRVDGITDDYVYGNGLTPPTFDIVSRWLAKKASDRTPEQAAVLDGIKYWEMIEIKLAAMIAKDRSSKPITRHEFCREPDVDPALLECTLRREGLTEFKGYSGREIGDEEIAAILEETEPRVSIPQAVIDEITTIETKEKAVEDDDDDGDEIAGLLMTGDDADDDEEEDEERDDERQEADSGTSSVRPSEDDNTSESDYDEEEEEEEDPLEAEIEKKEKRLGSMRVNMDATKNAMTRSVNDYMTQKYRETLERSIREAEQLEKDIQGLKARRRQK